MPDTLHGRCYCGAVRLTSAAAPLTVATCHCGDCRRLSGAPSNTFAAFAPSDVTFTPPLDAGASHFPGVRRWFCRDCGTPLAAEYDYLPDQLYIPVGLFDAVDILVPQRESHTASRVCWVPLNAAIPGSASSGRERLGQANGS